MKSNPLFWMPLKFIRGLIDMFHVKNAIELSQKKDCDILMVELIIKSLSIRTIPLTLLNLFTAPGFLYLAYSYYYKSIPEIPGAQIAAAFIINISLMVFVFILSILTEKFITKAHANADHIAIAHRFLLTKKRNFIYLLIATVIYTIDCYCSNDYLQMVSTQLFAAFLVYRPLYLTHKSLTNLKPKKSIFSFFNIINPQFFNRFRSNK